ncbi:hypothetical protein GOBAR_AA16953 [Gossypium barbadense]|uniref:Uncharacterized protein n=1 Tax=Gossypium barbadense TaxID=3634 RepID=A0A2P5XK34_GOSBA|nr:hypothetical protein GOBAR_AA16953 [Gossypium barbadense]
MVVLFSHGPKYARALGHVLVENLYSSAPAELRMTHLDRTEWENAKYCKRDFFIRCGSDNVFSIYASAIHLAPRFVAFDLHEWVLYYYLRMVHVLPLDSFPTKKVASYCQF